MSQQQTPHSFLALGADRRRMPRYSCSGHAQIASFPLTGRLLSGRIRDLGLGGCCIENIETTSAFDLGARTEILVNVNSWFFRTLAHVKAVRDRSRISVEFLRMSTGGYGMLTDLIADLDRPRPGSIRLKAIGAASTLELRRGPEPKPSPAIVGTIVPAESAQDALAASRQAWTRNLYPGATSLDIFA
jgi:PilZ domain-containing protein